MVVRVVDVGEAGEGSMEISVMPPTSGRNLHNDVQQVSNAMFEVSFTPTEPGNHRAHVLFNGEHVPGSVFVDPTLLRCIH